MDRDHLAQQRKRLKRHYSDALANRDPVSFLDLAHVLRIWVELKGTVDAEAQASSASLSFPNPRFSKADRPLLKGDRHIYLPIASGVDSPGVEIKGLRITNRALTPEEIKARFEAGPPMSQHVSLSFTQWLAAGIYEVPATDERHPHIRISREILIKRVANILGASHPAGADRADEFENRFDPYVLELHGIVIADGYPATYYQLLEIAKDVLSATRFLVDA